jgi:hypothetical protein
MNTAHDFQRAFNLDLGLDPAGVLALEVDFDELDFEALDFEALDFEALDFDELAFDVVFFVLAATALGLSLCRMDALTRFSSTGRWTSDNFLM